MCLINWKIRQRRNQNYYYNKYFFLFYMKLNNLIEKKAVLIWKLKLKKKN